MAKHKILHIAAHMGEGAGKAISGLMIGDINNYHEIILLEKPKKMDFVERSMAAGIVVSINSNLDFLCERIKECDLIVLNWWNHPSFVPVFRVLSDQKVRVLLWSHVNGWEYPQIPYAFTNEFDACMFTSSISLYPPHWTAKEVNNIQKKSDIVYGMGEFLPNKLPSKSSYDLHDPIRIGYVGTLAYSKLHPRYISFCKELVKKGLDVKFILAGNISVSLEEDIRREGLTDYFELLGFRKDIPELLTSFDIFSYLLNPNNFATTENALLEAMAAALPIVSGSSEAEKAILMNDKDSFIINTPEEYVNKIDELVSDIFLRRRLGKEARISVCKKYNVTDNCRRFSDIIDRAMLCEKKIHNFTSILGETPYEVFLANCPKNVKCVFEEVQTCTSKNQYTMLGKEVDGFDEIHKSSRKGSALHYLAYYPEDARLKKVCDLIQSKKYYE